MLQNFDLIYKKYKNEIKNDEEYLLKLAVTTSWAFAKDVYFWAGSDVPQDVVERYEIYKMSLVIGDDYVMFTFFLLLIWTRKCSIVWMPEFIIKMRRVFRGQWQPSIRKLHIVIWNTSGICRSFLPTRWHGAVGTVDFGDGMRH